MKKKIIIVLILFFVLLCSFLFFYFQEPKVVLKKKLTCEINTECNAFDYVKEVNKGLIVSKNKKIDSSKTGEIRIILETKNLVNRMYYYKFKVDVVDTSAPVISYNKEISITEGDNIDLLSGVSVYDNSLEDIKPIVTGEYDINRAGEYKLKYLAEDSSHNVTEEEFVLKVSKKPVINSGGYSGYNSYRNGYPYYIKVNRRLNVVYVYEAVNGEYSKLIKVFTCSTGRGSNTPLGVFATKNKYVWKELIGPCYGQYSTRITGQILFHSVPYQYQTKNSLEWWLYNRLGNNDSLGCIRLTTIDAKWIYDNCPIGTFVEIFQSNDLGGVEKPTTIRISADDPRRGWDPTDPDPANPWKTN
ncbi:MAG: L,D-transpeptidase family protein [Bacilli bacterium]|nr:L,D-transpeptidase family protein [Bacilli bacterium]